MRARSPGGMGRGRAPRAPASARPFRGRRPGHAAPSPPSPPLPARRSHPLCHHTTHHERRDRARVGLTALEARAKAIWAGRRRGACRRPGRAPRTVAPRDGRCGRQPPQRGRRRAAARAGGGGMAGRESRVSCRTGAGHRRARRGRGGGRAQRQTERRAGFRVPRAPGGAEGGGGGERGWCEKVRCRRRTRPRPAPPARGRRAPHAPARRRPRAGGRHRGQAGPPPRVPIHRLRCAPPLAGFNRHAAPGPMV